MSRIKIIFFAVLAVIGLSRGGYAAVRFITDTEYSMTPVSRVAGAAVDPEEQEDGGDGGDQEEVNKRSCDGLEQCIGTTCTLSGNASDINCGSTACCKDDAATKEYYCPADFAYEVTAETPNQSKLRTCEGTRKDGTAGKWSIENPESCTLYGLTNKVYLDELLEIDPQCQDYTTEHRCVYEYTGEDGTPTSEKVLWCQINDGVDLSNDMECPLNEDGTANYQTTDIRCIGDDGTEYQPAPCWVNCGDDMLCQGFICDLSVLPVCDDLIAERAAAGYKYPTYLSDTRSEDFPYVCSDGSSVKYVGFGTQSSDSGECKGDFVETDSSACDEGNGLVANTCTVMEAADSETSYYRCGCNVDGKEATRKTVPEYCQDIGNPADCLQKYYGEGEACTVDKDDNGKDLYKYEEFSDEIGLCSTSEQTYVLIDPVEDACTSVSNDTYEGMTYLLEKIQCRYVHTDTYKTDIQDKCQGCGNWMSTSAAGQQCLPGTSIVCPYGQDGVEDKAQAGCECKFEDGWLTLKEKCGISAIEDRLCEETITGTGDACKVYLFDESFTATEARYKTFACTESYMTLEEYCATNPDILPGYDCMSDYVGMGVPCKIDSPDNSAGWKYTNFGFKCPEDAGDKLSIKSNLNECMVPNDSTSQPEADMCYYINSETGLYDGLQKGYICRCPKNYGTECDKAYEIRGGNRCEYDRDAEGKIISKYKECGISCDSEFVAEHVAEAHNCSNIDSYISPVRGGTTTPEMCIVTGARTEHYICACPTNFTTLADWCAVNWQKEGLASVEECTSSYTGSGTACKRDITTDADGAPQTVLTKYAQYARYCPTDRPLYYSEEDCTLNNGEYQSSCLDPQNNIRTLCQCLESWYSDTQEDGGQVCRTQSLGDKELTAEPSGKFCDFDGYDKLKYEECIATCSSIVENPEIALPDSYIYLSSVNGTPTQNMCTSQLGNGAVLGYANQAYCSLNHSAMYPCYCPAGFRECLEEDNEVATGDATVCRANGKTYYSECIPVECEDEGPNLAVVDISADVAALFGKGAEFKVCSRGGTPMKQVSCDTSVYTDPCDYPYEAPKEGTWCKYNTSGAMADGRNYYQAGACRVKKELGVCGASIIEGDTSRTDYMILTADSESECISKYGPGISTQLCEYDAANGYKRAYNCYYDPDEFKYTTSNCGVRHDLSGDYIVVNGQKRWRECNCAGAYQHHKFNCGGLLSGNACQQEISTALASADPTIGEAIDEGYLSVGDTLPFYPYCECSADYTEVCDEDGSGRYKGVGQACNGKYKSCECIPDELPVNWADNYYGCPGGKKPTGVWKDNGCGHKYYQCSKIECTWEYTEKCLSPLLPVGQPCQDNMGNIGGYKACTCPPGYKVCPTGQVGEGEPCNLKGVPYYKSCKMQEGCSTTANKLCNGPLQIGVNPCTREGETYYESCVCANGYTEVCADGEVGIGGYCELDGVKYYKECTKPEENTCTAGHVTVCDTNQESYSPCVDTDSDGQQIIKYLCRCPSNWYTADTCPSGVLGGDTCTQVNTAGISTVYRSECAAVETCSEYQDLTYQVCTDAQTGEGSSCQTTGENGETITKYAICRDGNSCLENGFKYSCSGYNEAGLGESCVDENGNRLYKECPCPPSWDSCNSPNATKGQKCTPLLVDGSYGTTVYSSCECDRSRYKYTCETEGGNKGIVPPDTQNYCEVTEVVTETSEDGSTSQEIEKTVRYYASCACQDDYKYTCNNAAAGDVLPAGYENDYCQINSAKFYKGCDCASQYTVSEESCGSGQMVDMTKGSCAIRGLVPETSTGNGTTYKPNQTLYTACICKPNYILPCNDSVYYDQSGIESCDLSGTALYPQCKCNIPDPKQCVAAGLNQGIMPDESAVCVEKTADNDGNIVSNSKYAACTCKRDYVTPASSCTGSNYNMVDEPYCDAGNGNGVMYKECVCDDEIFDLAKGQSSADAATACGSADNINPDIEVQFCRNIRGTSETGLYYPNKLLCL